MKNLYSLLLQSTSHVMTTTKIKYHYNPVYKCTLNYDTVEYAGGMNGLECTVVTASYDGGCCSGWYGAVADFCCCDDVSGCSF